MISLNVIITSASNVSLALFFFFPNKSEKEKKPTTSIVLYFYAMMFSLSYVLYVTLPAFLHSKRYLV